MARVTVEDCLDEVDNRFELVRVAAIRARQLATGTSDAKLDWENDKPTVLALREIAAGAVTEEGMRLEEEAREAAQHMQGF